MMSVDSVETNCLETLPIEILHIIVDFLTPWDVEDLSCASKRLREACLSSLFRRVEFQFSEARFDGLKSLLKSDARNHIVSFTYAVPELLKADILDFDYFKSNILTPDSYVEIAKDLYDVGGEADECPPYMVIYEAVYNICKEQRNIVDSGADLLVLSSTLGALPRLTEVGLSFCKGVAPDSALLSPFDLDMIAADESYEHHIRVVSDAIQTARNSGVTIYTIGLLEFNLPLYSTWKLLESVQVLRLTRSNSPLELLSHSALNLHQLDMCHIVPKYNSLKGFLEMNKRSICSIGFHDVKIIGLSRHPQGPHPELSSGILCQMLNVPQSTPCRAVDYGCLFFRKDGWRLLLNDNHL